MTINQIFVLGLYAGCVIGGPYGPSGSLSLYRSIRYGWRIGLSTASGSLLAIFLFSFLSALFIEFASYVINYQHIITKIRLAFGIVLLVAGIKLGYSNLKSNFDKKDLEENDHLGTWTSMISSFVVGLVSGKNLIGFPSFLFATQYVTSNSIPALIKAVAFSSGSLLSSSILYILLVAIGARLKAFLGRCIFVFVKHTIPFIFIGLGLYLIVHGLL